MPFDFTSLIPTVVGSVLGGAASSGSQTQTANRDPWGPAQPYLLGNLQNLADQQKFYQANPLSADQQRIYQNLMNNNDIFQRSIGPGLLGFAGSLASQQYQRPTGGRPGEGAGYGGPRQAPQTFNPWAAYQQNANPQGYVPQAQTNFAAMNPYSQFIPDLQKQRADAAASAAASAATKPTIPANVDPVRGGGGYRGTSSGQMDHQSIADIGNLGQTLSGLPGGLGLLGAGLVAISDGMASSNDGYSDSSSPTGYADARDAAAKDLGKGNAGGDRAGGYGGEGHDPGEGGNHADGKGDGSGYAKGGEVRGLLGPNPPGPDDGYAKLKRGEYVINKKAAQAIGKKKLDEMNRKGK